MARYSMMSEKDLNSFFGEIYCKAPFVSLDYYCGMLEVVEIMGLTNEWEDYVDSREERERLERSPERFRDCYN